MGEKSKENLQNAMTIAAAEMRISGYKTKVHMSPLVNEISSRMSQGQATNSIANWHEEMRKDNPKLPKLTISSLNTFRRKYLDEFVKTHPNEVVEVNDQFLMSYQEVYKQHKVDGFESLLFLAETLRNNLVRLNQANKEMPKMFVSNQFLGLVDRYHEVAKTLLDFEIRLSLRTGQQKAPNTVNILNNGGNVNVAKFEQFYEENPIKTFEQIIEYGHKIIARESRPNPKILPNGEQTI